MSRAHAHVRLETAVSIIPFFIISASDDGGDDNGSGGDPDLGDGDSGAGDNEGGDPFAVVQVVWQPFRTAHSYYFGRIAQDQDYMDSWLGYTRTPHFS